MAPGPKSSMGAPMAIPTSLGINTLLTWGQEQSKTWKAPGSSVSKGGWISGKSPFQTGSPFPLEALCTVLVCSLLEEILPPSSALTAVRLQGVTRQSLALSTAGWELLPAHPTRSSMGRGSWQGWDTLDTLDRRRPGRSHGRELQVPWASSRKRGKEQTRKIVYAHTHRPALGTVLPAGTRSLKSPGKPTGKILQVWV